MSIWLTLPHARRPGVLDIRVLKEQTGHVLRSRPFGPPSTRHRLTPQWCGAASSHIAQLRDRNAPAPGLAAMHSS